MIATLVSVVPFPVEEKYVGLRPAHFKIPAVKPGDIEVIHIPDGVNLRYIDEDRGTFEQPVPGEQIARSVIYDYTMSQLEASNDACPGLFYLNGELDKAAVKKMHAAKIAEAYARQEAWFHKLIKQADDLWARYGQHKMITDTARKAIQILGLQREWSDPTKVTRCPACYETVMPAAVVCRSCKAVLNPDEYAKFMFAGSVADIPKPSETAKK